MRGKRIIAQLLVAVALAPSLPAAEGAGDFLQWKNGDRLPGRLLGLEENWLEWDSPLLDGPLKVWMPRLFGWTGSGTVTVMNGRYDSGWVARMVDGSQLHADQAEVTPDHRLRLTGTRCGTLTLELDHLVDLRRLVPLDWIWHNGLQKVETLWGRNANKGRQRWDWSRGGVLSTWTRGIGMKGCFGLPQRQADGIGHEMPTRLRITLRGRETLDFTMAITLTEHHVMLRTWGAEVVAGSGLDFVLLGSVPQSGKPLVLDLGLDPSSGQAVAWDSDGKELARWPLALGTTVPLMDARQLLKLDGGWLALVNQGCHLEVSDVTRLPWTTDAPPTQGKISGAACRVVWADGRIEGAAEVPQNLDGIVALAWDRQPEGSPSPSEPYVMNLARADAVFADGDWLHGEWLRADTENLTFQTHPWGGEVKARWSDLTRLDFHQPDPFPHVPGGTVSRLDHLRRGTEEQKDRPPQLQGKWKPAPGPALLWQPDGAAQARHLRMEAEALKQWTLEVTQPPVFSQSELDLPELAHLITGERLPLAETQWTDHGSLRWKPQASAGSAEAWREGGLIAWEPRQEQSKETGFFPSVWLPFRGAPSMLQWEGDGTVTLKPGASIWMPTALVSEQIDWQIKALNGGYGALRIRLFCDGIVRSGKDMEASFLMAAFGNELICGEEWKESPGQLRNDVRLPYQRDKNINCRLKIKGASVTLTINGIDAMTLTVDEKFRHGFGLALEPASVWGNEVQPKVLRNFQMKSSVAARYRPQPDDAARRWLSRLPRNMQDDRPANFLVARNGDTLRGTVEAATSQRYAVRLGLDTVSVPADRVAAILFPQETSAISGEASPSSAVVEPNADSTWVWMLNGGLVHGKVIDWGPTALLIQSNTGGNLAVPTAEIVKLVHGVEGAPEPPVWDWKVEDAPDPQLATQTTEEIGQQAPGLKLPRLDGEVYDLGKDRGRIVILDFWASWCGPCLKGLPEVMALARDYAASDVRLIGVNQAEPTEHVAQFLQGRGWELDVVLDADQTVSRAYGVEGIPHTVIIDAEGHLAWVGRGYSPEAAQEMRAILDGLLAKKTVQP